MKLTYRPEIDGLRAIAVGAVILYHAQITILDHQPFKGGFIGVDIFFVISGYLITTFIIKENDKKNFSLIKFYERRARRILPLLLIVLLITTSISYFLFTPTYLDFYYKSVLAALFFYSNFFFWNESGYFETGSDIKQKRNALEVSHRREQVSAVLASKVKKHVMAIHAIQWNPKFTNSTSS